MGLALSAAAFLGQGHEHTRWLSPLTVAEHLRGQGWGRAILAAIEQHETLRGSTDIWLRVFNWNLVARRLYETHGYQLVRQFSTDTHLRKSLPTA